jgi:hypothetical protein
MVGAVSPTLIELGREECLRLLGAAKVGRVVVLTPGGTPVIRPVNYVLDGASQSVVFRCAEGTKLVSLLHAARAWFEVDAIDPSTAPGGASSSPVSPRRSPGPTRSGDSTGWRWTAGSPVPARCGSAFARVWSPGGACAGP